MFLNLIATTVYIISDIWERCDKQQVGFLRGKNDVTNSDVKN